MLQPANVGSTRPYDCAEADESPPRRRRRFRLRISRGPSAGAAIEGGEAEVAIGSAAGNHLVIADPLVSRRHLVVRWCKRSYWAIDVGSTNGTRVGEHLVQAAMLADGSELALGDSAVVFELLDAEVDAGAGEAAVAEVARWGPLLGGSEAMQRLFAVVPRIAWSEATVLIEGETGTGKSMLARALHDASPRAAAPFVVVDCASIPPSLIESVLFGHERGAFTGAHAARAGAFEAACGGTVFLDEIGELPLALQPKLLRALEAREIQRLGGAGPVRLDVRIVAATHRDLRALAARGAFRADLLYRLRVVALTMPALRDRRADIPALAAHLYRERAGAAPPAALLERLAHQDWPGNVRELRNAIERAIVLGDAARGPAGPAAGAALDTDAFDPAIAFREAKADAIARWERWYIRALLRHTGGNLSRAARIAQSDRSYLRKLAQRHVRRPSPHADEDLSWRP